MNLDSNTKAKIKLLRDATSELIEADEFGDALLFEKLGNTYGPIARKIFFELQKTHPILLNPWAVANRARQCQSDVGSFEFWSHGDMVISLCGLLDVLNIEVPDYASA